MKLILISTLAVSLLLVSSAFGQFNPVTTHFETLAENAKGSQLRPRVNAMVALAKSKKFDEVETEARELEKTFEAMFDRTLKQYTFESKEEWQDFSGSTQEKFEWIDSGYRQCLQMQAFVLSEKKAFPEAIELLNKLEAVAPVSASPGIESGYALIQLKRFDEALGKYQKAYAFSKKYKSQKSYGGAALRGIGFAMTELHRLDDAEKAYKDSLELEPGNQVAMGELKYIQRMRSQK